MARLSNRNKLLTFVPGLQSADVSSMIQLTADDVVPTGWLECNGQAVRIA